MKGRALCFASLCLILLVVMPARAQKAQIIGRVVDNFGKPIAGVTVAIQNSAFRTSTDQDGTYRIRYAPGTFALAFQKLGYVSAWRQLSLADTPERRLGEPAAGRVQSLGSAGPDEAPEKGHRDYVYAVAFSPDGRLIATAGGDNTIRLWEVATGREVWAIAADGRQILFAPDSLRLAGIVGEGTVKLWDVTSGVEVDSFSLNPYVVFGLAFSQNGQVLAIGGQYAKVSITPDGESLVTLEPTRVWNLTAAREVLVVKDATSAVISPDGRLLATWHSDDRTIGIWDLLTTHKRTTLSDVRAAFGPYLNFSPDGRRLAVWGGDLIQVWEVTKSRLLRTVMIESLDINRVVFGPDPQLFATANFDDNSASVWDLSSGRELRTFEGHTSRVNDVAFSRDGRYLATASNDKTAMIWNATTSSQVRILGTIKRILAPGSGQWADIDFANFSYPLSSSCQDFFPKYPVDQVAQVRNGQFVRGRGKAKNVLTVSKVFYGDLTADGSDEAVVVTYCHSAGAANPGADVATFYIYTLQKGLPIMVTMFDPRVELRAVELNAGVLSIEHADGGPRCCPTTVVRRTYRLRGSRLVLVGEKKKPWQNR